MVVAVESSSLKNEQKFVHATHSFVPTKIYGRADELAILYNAYRRHTNVGAYVDAYDVTNTTTTSSGTERNNELIFIEGIAGIGKTVLAESLRAHVEHDGGYFVKLKCNRIQLGIADPQAVLLSIFKDLVEDVIRQKRQDEMRHFIQNSPNVTDVEESLSTLIELVPELAQIFQELPKVKVNVKSDQTSLIGPIFSGVAESTLKNCLRTFLKAINFSANPIILFVDNLQWGGAFGWDLLNRMIGGWFPKLRILYVVAATKEVNYHKSSFNDGCNMVQSLLSRWQSQTNLDVSTIELTTIEKCYVKELVSDVLLGKIDVSNLEDLSMFLFDQTGGHPLFILDYLNYMATIGTLRCEQNKWKWDRKDSYHPEYTSLLEFYQSRISDLPESDQETLKLAACLGGKINISILMLLLASGSLVDLKQSSLVLQKLLYWNEDKCTLEFVHDCVQAMVYNSITEQDRKRYHHYIGRAMWKHFDMENLDKSIFTVAGHLLLGLGLAPKNIILNEIGTDVSSTHTLENELPIHPDTEAERVAVAKLCIRAGERVAEGSFFLASLTCLRHAMRLLGPHSWEQNYSLCLTLYNSAAEIAYCAGKVELVPEYVHIVLRYACNLDDTLRARTIEVYALGSSGNIERATKRGLDLLHDLGMKISGKTSSLHFFMQVNFLKHKLGRMSEKKILQLPLMEDHRKLAAMQILSVTIVHALMLNPLRAYHLSLTLIMFTLRHGMCAVSSIGFVMWGNILCSFYKDFNEGFRMGRLALSMSEKFNTKSWFARLSTIYFASLHCFRYPVQEITEPLLKAYRLGVQTGDIQCAMMSYNILCFSKIHIEPLDVTEKRCEVAGRRMQLLGQNLTRSMSKSVRQFILNLRGMSSGCVTEYSGEFLSEAELVTYEKTFEWLFLLSNAHRLILCYCFGEYDKCLYHANKCRRIAQAPFNTMALVLMNLFDALSDIAIARQRNKRRANSAKRISVFLGQIAESSPINFLGMHYLVEAELKSIKLKHRFAFSKYIIAISMSKELKSPFLTALCNERLAKYVYDKVDKASSFPYFKEALRFYEEWGATAKVLHLANKINNYCFD